ncbi:MAG TPA: SPOR domain-containing protein [Chitinophagales bacterium]|nr:SPOR domain-containing protein [Chitinophagales bacterium]HNM32479.1 SPOR domain-containing protein [Chitinophagales bacterium]
MKKYSIVAAVLVAFSNFASAALLHNDYSYLQDITFELYTDEVPAYKVPSSLKSIEETLMYDVLHATWKDNHWVAYTLNKDLLGAYKVGQPALLDKDDVKKIFFVAGFPGSIGGLDLYTAEYTNGKWSKPKNLGKGINTAGNEANPGLLNENTLTYSSAGVIKKLDLTTLKVVDLVETPAIESKKTESTTTVVVDKTAPKPMVEEMPIVPQPVKQEPAKQLADAPKKTEILPATTAPITTAVAVSAASATTSADIQAYGVQTRDAMLAKFKTAIQLGAFSNPKWEQLRALSKYGKLITYKNENGANVVWLVGFSNRTAAESVLSQVRATPGFENAYITGK